jgi:hypothetical protein
VKIDGGPRDLVRRETIVTKTKGTVLRSMRRAAARTYGAETVERAVDGMKMPARADFASGFDGSGWYPITHVDAFYEAFLPMVDGDLKTVRSLAAKAMEDDIGSFYRLILRAFDPSSVLNFGLRVWRTIYDAGQVTVDKQGPGKLVVHVSGVTGFSRYAWNDVLGGIDAMVAMSRANGKQVRVVGGGDDGPSMSIEVLWSAGGAE